MKKTDQSKKNGLFAAIKNQSKKICLGIGLMTLIMLYTWISVNIKAENNDTSENDLYYIGNVTSNVNVRVGPGESSDRLTYKGSFVQLKNGDKVAILSEEMVGKKPWYFIEFDYDGELLRGYSTSSYIIKTDIVITPTPLPTIEPTLTPTPTIEPTKEPVPTDSVIQAEPEPKKNKSLNDYIIPVIVLIIAGAACASVLIMRKVQSASENNEMSKAVKKLQNVKITDKDSSSDRKSKKTPEIKASKKNSLVNEDKKLIAPGVYVKESEKDYDLSDDNKEDEIKGIASKESEEKKRLRKEIDSLIEHDIVEHKYFGKGEVFDNSDVKLIEVRFGNDVRFLNKDSLVAKKLLKKSDEGNTRWNM